MVVVVVVNVKSQSRSAVFATQNLLLNLCEKTVHEKDRHINSACKLSLHTCMNKLAACPRM